MKSSSLCFFVQIVLLRLCQKYNIPVNKIVNVFLKSDVKSNGRIILKMAFLSGSAICQNELNIIVKQLQTEAFWMNVIFLGSTIAQVFLIIMML